MKQNLLTKMKEEFHTFSKGQKRIASYVLEHYDKACFMTAAKLAATVEISESTVVRFACELGFDGYPAFQKALQEIARNRLNNIQRMELSFDRIGDNVFEKVLNFDIERIRQTLEEASVENFNEAVNSIISAKNIYIVGTKSSSVLASFLAYYLGLVFKNVHLVHAGHSTGLYEQIFRIDPNDIMIGISFPRYSSHTVKALQFAKDNGANTLAITDSMLSPLTEYARHLLLARSDMASFVDSLVAPLSVLNALIVAISIKLRDQTENSFKILEGIWEKYEVYQKSEEN